MEFLCPRCRGALRPSSSAHRCLGCDASYPIVAGIPDLRVAPDPWIDIEADRAKGLRLLERSRGASFESMVNEYWAMTPTTPKVFADRFIDHVLHAEERSSEWLANQSGAVGSGPALDLGCGTADLAVALKGRHVVCVDVAFRWLVVAKRRLAERGVDATVVCANAEALPFASGTFESVLSLGLVEHCADVRAVCAEMARVLEPGGAARLRTVNRYSVLAEPHVGVWGVGFLPRRYADRYVKKMSGQRYLHHAPHGWRELGASLTTSGMIDVRVEAAQILESELRRLSPRARALVPFYNRSRSIADVVLREIAPLLEAQGRRADSKV